MDPLYAIFNLDNLGYFRIPITCVRYFYVVRCENNDFRIRKYNFSYKMNIVSVNDKAILSDEIGVECKISMCVGENYKVHHDAFVLGCKFDTNGLMLTSNFYLADICFFGITGYISFREWIKNHEKINYKLIKRYFCYPAFQNQIMAMYQCVECYKVLEKLLIKLTSGPLLLRGFDVFAKFKKCVRFN